MKKLLFPLVLIGVTAGVALYLRRPVAETGMQRQTRFLMDTVCTIQVPGPESVRPAMARAFARIEELDNKFNAHNKASAVYQFNNSGTPITDPEIVSIIEKACEVSRVTGDGFDITVYPLVELWGFYTNSPHVPDEGDIREALKKISWRKLVLEKGRVSKTNDYLKIDLGSVAKGYIVGEALKVLKESGITNALIDAGGDIFATGMVKGRQWKVGVRSPRGEGIMCGLDISEKSLSTAGDYERYFEKDGKRYHHIFDARTGYPATNNMSITLISSDATLVDMYDTALFLMPADEAMKIVQARLGAEAVIVNAAGKVQLSGGLTDYVKIQDIQEHDLKPEPLPQN